MPAITALYAGLIAILLFIVAGRVSGLRRTHNVGIGDGGREDLARAIRVHGNAVEWALPALLLLLIAELNRAPAILLHVAGIVLVIARVLHALGLSGQSGYSFGRFSGAATTYIVVLVLAIWDIWAFVRLLLI
jgi:uncharacterized membrane protein YecN with MAPEG domain